jgi:hypothetical protein
MKPSLRLLTGAALCIAFAGAAPAAVVVDPNYASSYTLFDLGEVAGVPANYGGLTMKQGDDGTLLLSGAANTPSAKIYSVPVQRDATGHITGFGGTATFFANARGTMGGIDGGLAYAPNGALLYTVFPDNQIGQIKPGSTGADKLVTMTAVRRFLGGLTVVPSGLPGAGRLKVTWVVGNRWSDAVLTPDGTGTYNITPSAVNISLGGAPEGIVYVPLGSALFPEPSVLIAESGTGEIAAYQVNANGDPIISTRKTFVSGLDFPQGAAIDPLTGDFLFSDFLSGHILRVGIVPIPEADTWVLVLLGLGAVGAVARRRR